jgi:hypothetical protein
MTIVSRLELDHPALGTAGGVALHASIEALYTKIGDNINARYFTSENLNDGAAASFDHNFNISSFDDLRYDLYLWNVGTGELTLVSVDDLADWVIEATPGSEKTHIRVTNNTGSQQDIVLVVLNDPIVLNELVDVDTAGAEDGQALVFRNSDKKWVPGASGDSSFKIQSLLADGTITIKGGYYVAGDGRILATYDGAGTAETDFGKDISFDIDSLITPVDETTYWLYVDIYTLPAAIAVTGTNRELTPVVSTNFYLSTTNFINIDQFRYLKVGIVRRATAAWATTPIITYPSKIMVPNVVVSPKVFGTAKVIGSVGDSDQISAGHVLAQGSFPSAGFANTSFFNLSSVSTVNDGNTTLAHNLTNNGSMLFDQIGIMGVDDACPGFDGVDDYLSSTDAHFDPGDTDWSAGGWFKPTSWNDSNTYTLFSQWNYTDNKRCFACWCSEGLLKFWGSTNGTSGLYNAIDCSGFTGWQHVVIKYVASTNTMSCYVNGIKLSEVILSAGLATAGLTYRKFNIGSQNNGNSLFVGLVDEFFFCNGNAFSDDEIWKIYAAKISHSSGLAPTNQDWRSVVSAGDFTRDLNDSIVDIDSNDLYIDNSGQLSTATANYDLFNKSISGFVSASRSKEYLDTATNLDALFATTPLHGLPGVPKLILEVEIGSGYWEIKDAASFLKSSATAIAQNGVDTLATIFGGSTNCKLTAYCGQNASYVPAKSWQTLVKSAAYSLIAWDEVLANPTGQMILTLPASPNLGDKVRIIDFDGTWSLTDYVRVARNGKKIHGASDDLDLTTAGDSCELVYNGTDDWRIA